MRFGRRIGGKTGSTGKRARRSLLANPLFPATLGIWGFALGGLVILVLPRDLALAGAAKVGLGMLGAQAPFVLAALSAAALGMALLVAARWLARRVRGRAALSVAAMAMRHVRMIDPARELGSASLDEPLDAAPFPVVTQETAPQAEPGLAASADDLPAPRSLALEEFAALPGRNAVWVEEAPADQPEPAAPLHAAPAIRPVMPTAIERLRAVPPSELSLVQMVERFAAALHAHQTVPARDGRPLDAAGRDAALAEALKALAALTGENRGTGEDEPLREALARLQELRGAA